MTGSGRDNRNCNGEPAADRGLITTENCRFCAEKKSDSWGKKNAESTLRTVVALFSTPFEISLSMSKSGPAKRDSGISFSFPPSSSFFSGRGSGRSRVSAPLPFLWTQAGSSRFLARGPRFQYTNLFERPKIEQRRGRASSVLCVSSLTAYL